MRLTVLLITLFMALSAFAGKVSEQQALTIAAQFAQKHGLSVKAPSPTLAKRGMPRKHTGENDASYYVFNMSEGKGFVVVSGDDRLGGVLGYSTSGKFDESRIPDGLAWMLETYSSSIENLGSDGKALRAPAARPAIPYLIKTQWDQGDPYNLQTPMQSGEHTWTGCVATAMAQVLYYWRCPSGSTTAIPAYSYGEELPATTFDWDKMLLTYSDDSPEESKEAVAKLMHYCGQAVKMSYGTSASSAILYSQSLARFLGFSPKAASLSRDDITSAQWENIIYTELKENRPVLYGGFSNNGNVGHQFICDGYDGNGYYHFNWGWGGYCDGYFSLNALFIPDGREGSDYNSQQNIVRNVQPAEPGEQVSTGVLELYSSFKVSNSDSIGKRSKAGESFSFSSYPDLNTYVINPGFDEDSYQWNLAIYKGDELVATYPYNGYYLNKNISMGRYLSASRSLPSDLYNNLPDGTYRVVPVSRLYDDTNTKPYSPCLGSDVRYVEATIKDNTLTFRAKPDNTGDGKFSVSDLTYEGKLKQGHTITVKFKLSNTGTGGSEVAYRVQLGNATTIANSFCDAGETVDVSVQLNLNTAGTGSFSVVNYDHITDTLYASTETYAVEPYSTTTLEGSLENQHIQKENGQIAKPLSLTLTNKGNTDYDDDIMFSVYHKDSNNTLMPDRVFDVAVNVPANSTVTVPIKIDGLNTAYEEYYVNASYYYRGNEKELTYTQFNIYDPVLVAEPKDMGSLNCCPESITSTIKNEGLTDYKGKLYVYTYKQKDGDNRYYDEYKVDVDLPVNGTYQLEYHPAIENVIDSGKYVVYIGPENGYYNDLTEIARFNILPGKIQDLEAVVLGNEYKLEKTMNVKFINKGTNDYDNAVGLSLYCQTNGEKYSHVAFSKFSHVSIPAGDSITVSFDLSEMNEVGSYYGSLRYVSENDINYSKYLNYFTFDDDMVEISDVKVEGVIKEGRECMVSFTATNKMQQDLYIPYLITVNDSITKVQRESLDSGMTKRIKLVLPITSVGNLHVKLYKGNTWFADTFYATTLHADEANEANIIADGIIKSMAADGEGTNAYTISYRVTNHLDTDFNDALYINWSMTDADNYWNGSQDTILYVNIPAKSTVTIPLVIGNIDNTYRVGISAAYYNLMNRTFLEYLSIYPTMPILSVETQDFGSVQSAPSTISIPITNVGNADYNDQVTVSIEQLQGMYYTTYYENTQTISVPANGSFTLSIPIERDEYRPEGKYEVKVSYLINNSYVYTDLAATFVIDKATAIKSIDSDSSTSLRVFDLSGRYIGTMSRSEMPLKLKKGIYIVGGRKIAIP